MAFRKWSEQALVEESFGYKDENGNEVINVQNCLQVCIAGKELYKREFKDKKYRMKNLLDYEFDFIVEAGDMCPKGRFYELEYTIGEHGLVYHALIQAVDPVTDIPLIIGMLKKRNVVPAELKSHRAWLRSDIDALCIGSCSKDEDGEISFYSSHVEAQDRKNDDGECVSVLDYAVKYGNLGCCLYYYRGDCREVWVPQECDCSKEKVFVCGVNGNDPDFAAQREQALEELEEHLTSAIEILSDYGLNFFMAWENGEVNQENGKRVSNIEEKCTEKWFYDMLDALTKSTEMFKAPSEDEEASE